MIKTVSGRVFQADTELTPPAGADKPERSGGFLIPMADLVKHYPALSRIP
jgi:hypothetical protein